jgi:hypothetical protein
LRLSRYIAWVCASTSGTLIRNYSGLNPELNSQLSMIKIAPTSKDSETRALTARWTNSERRLVNTQNQLATAEEKNTFFQERQLTADQKWDAHVKEYELAKGQNSGREGDEREARREGEAQRAGEPRQVSRLCGSSSMILN